jgi:hypothetical protein
LGGDRVEDEKICCDLFYRRQEEDEKNEDSGGRAMNKYN